MTKVSGKNQKFAFIIPAYNEAPVIRSVITDLQNQLDNKGFNYRVIVVSDGSHDDTAQIAAAIKSTAAISHVINMGAGAATRTGIAYARINNFDYAVTLDADGQHLPEDVIRVAEALTKHKSDLIIGNRLADKEGMPALKRIGNKGLSIITQIIYGSNIQDSQSGLRGFNQKALSKITYNSNRYAFCSEMIWRAKLTGLTISEIPIKAVYTDYSVGAGRGQSNWGAVEIVRQMIKMRIKELVR